MRSGTPDKRRVPRSTAIATLVSRLNRLSNYLDGAGDQFLQALFGGSSARALSPVAGEG